MSVEFLAPTTSCISNRTVAKPKFGDPGKMETRGCNSPPLRLMLCVSRLRRMEGKMPDQRWRIFLVPTSGGAVRAITPEEQRVAGPTWAPDSRQIMFSAVPDWWPGGATLRAPISILTLESGAIEVVPNDEHLWSPRWSPNGRYIVAMAADWTKLMLFDFTNRRWREVATGETFDFPEWYPNSESIYVTDHTGNRTRLVRIAI